MDAKKIRLKNGVTARELAELLGINIRTWWRIEEGRRKLRQCEIDAIGKHIDELEKSRERWNEILYSKRGGA